MELRELLKSKLSELANANSGVQQVLDTVNKGLENVLNEKKEIESKILIAKDNFQRLISDIEKKKKEWEDFSKSEREKLDADKSSVRASIVDSENKSKETSSLRDQAQRFSEQITLRLKEVDSLKLEYQEKLNKIQNLITSVK